MKRPWRAVLILVAVVSFGIALSYPILYRKAREENEDTLNSLAQMRREILQKETPGEEKEPGSEGASGEGLQPAPDERSGGDGSVLDSEDEPAARAETAPGEEAPLGLSDLLLDYVPGMTWRQVTIPEYENLEAPVMVSGRTAARNREQRTQALPYPLKEKVLLDPERILPELAPIYEKNQDLVGWLSIEDTVIDYPVVQSKDSEFYLHHDFYGQENENGQIILDTKCDPYTPSYNLVISGHHMRNGSMFGGLPQYSDYDYWASHKLVEFDHLMGRGTYVIFAAFYSADYDEDEEGFRYNADIRYLIDAKQWLEEIRNNMLYDTGIDAQFGDAFITLTTCDRSRRADGRFVLICRKLREGETIS